MGGFALLPRHIGESLPVGKIHSGISLLLGQCHAGNSLLFLHGHTLLCVLQISGGLGRIPLDSGSGLLVGQALLEFLFPLFQRHVHAHFLLFE